MVGNYILNIDVTQRNAITIDHIDVTQRDFLSWGLNNRGSYTRADKKELETHLELGTTLRQYKKWLNGRNLPGELLKRMSSLDSAAMNSASKERLQKLVQKS
jgi:hypothetical protein